MQGDAKSCNLKESPYPGCRPYPLYRLMPFNQPIQKPMDNSATALRSYGLQTTAHRSCLRDSWREQKGMSEDSLTEGNRIHGHHQEE